MQQDVQQQEASYDELIQEINRKFKTKASLYKYLVEKTRIFLPRQGYCTLEFMHALLLETKVIQTQNEVPRDPHIPNWPELAVRKVWPHAIQLPGVLERLPDEWNGNLRTDRNFFWCTLIGLHHRWVSHLIDDCTRQRRRRAAARQMPRRTIQIRHDIARRLVEHEFRIRESRHPHRGASIFATRARRQQQPRIRQPVVIMPNFSVEQYLRELERSADEGSNRNQGGSDRGSAVLNQSVQNPNLEGLEINLDLPQQQQPGLPPRPPSNRPRANSISAGSRHSFGQQPVPNHQQMEQFRPQIGQSNTTMLSGPRGNLLDMDALNRQVAQQQAIIEEDEEEVQSYNAGANRSPDLPAHLRDPNFNGMQQQQHLETTPISDEFPDE